MNGRDVAVLGQVFTPPAVVRTMLALLRNGRRVLEPSCGDGAFSRQLPGCVALELDARHAPPGARIMDFFSLPVSERFDTVIGNPPYVRIQDVAETTRVLLPGGRLDGRANLYLHFIDKCLDHLTESGELIFITPRDFLKATSAVALNRRLCALGSFTEVVELGDARVFDDAVPNCLIWRYEKGRREQTLRFAEVGVGQRLDAALANLQWEPRRLEESGGHLAFVRDEAGAVQLGKIAAVRVGGVSGADRIFTCDTHGTRDFVCSETVRTGKTRRMIWQEETPHPALVPHKQALLARRVRPFDDSNWWQWGRGYPQNDLPRVYVNGKTRQPRPFFTHPCTHYDGAVLALFPRAQGVEADDLAAALNGVDWALVGFRCDGRFLFTQRSLSHALLPAGFARFLPVS